MGMRTEATTHPQMGEGGGGRGGGGISAAGLKERGERHEPLEINYKTWIGTRLLAAHFLRGPGSVSQGLNRITDRRTAQRD